MLKPAAKERQRAGGGDKVSKDAKALVAKLPQPVSPGKKAREEAAELLNVSPR